MTRDRIESLIMTADDIEEYNEYLDELDANEQFPPLTIEEEDALYRRLSNERAIETILANRGIKVNLMPMD